MEDEVFKRRSGRFSISMDLIDECVESGDDMDMVFAGVVVTRAERDYPRKEIKYNANSRHFDEIVIGDTIPLYLCICHHENGSMVSVEWERVTDTFEGPLKF